jgi:hypothetical protein
MPTFRVKMQSMERMENEKARLPVAYEDQGDKFDVQLGPIAPNLNSGCPSGNIASSEGSKLAPR